MAMENLENKQLGLRIKAARILTGLNQEEFAKKCDFNYASLRNWEFGRFTPRKEAIERLINAFRSFSISVDPNWIFYGKGEGPIFTQDKFEKPNSHLFEEELETFKKNCTNRGDIPIVLQVEDDLMAPLFLKYDWLGACTASLLKLSQHAQSRQIFAKPMLVKLEDRKFSVRYVCHDGENWFARSQGESRLLRIKCDVVGFVQLHLCAKF